jgi:hypothetical protein
MSDQPVETRLNALLLLSMVAVSLLSGLTFARQVANRLVFSGLTFALLASLVLVATLARSTPE